MNNYTIFRNQLLEGQPTKWLPYFVDISYASGIKFIQNNRFSNVKFAMQKNREEPKTVHAHQLLRRSILENAGMSATQAAEQAGFGDPYDDQDAYSEYTGGGL